MNIFRATISLFLCLALFGFSGGQEKPSASTQLNSSAHVKTTKPGAAIKLVSSSTIYITPHEITNIDLLLDAKDSVGTLTLEFSVTSGLEVLNSSMQKSIKLTSTTPVKIPMTLRAANGRYYLNIQASIDNGDTVTSRNLAVIVQVGAETEKSVQLKKSSGENVISLPAQETISNQ